VISDGSKRSAQTRRLNRDTRVGSRCLHAPSTKASARLSVASWETH